MSALSIGLSLTPLQARYMGWVAGGRKANGGIVGYKEGGEVKEYGAGGGGGGLVVIIAKTAITGSANISVAGADGHATAGAKGGGGGYSGEPGGHAGIGGSGGGTAGTNTSAVYGGGGDGIVPGKNGEAGYRDWETDRKSTRLNSSHITRSRMPSSA